MARYIDADKFISELEQEKTVALEFEDGVAVYEIEHTMNLIGMQPTADVVPKSEGEWVHDMNNLYGCSNCLWRSVMSPKKMLPYCPHCGTKMKGGE